MRDSWFCIPTDAGNYDAADEIEAVVPVEGKVKFHVSLLHDLHRVRQVIDEHEGKQRIRLSGRLSDRLQSVCACYERLAENALSGAEQVREDMLIYLRSIIFVLQTVLAAGTHAEKGARLRGCIEVLEAHVSSLREERFSFHDSAWRRNPDLFRWDGPERRLRERVRELESEIERLKEAQGGDR